MYTVRGHLVETERGTNHGERSDCARYAGENFSDGFDLFRVFSVRPAHCRSARPLRRSAQFF